MNKTFLLILCPFLFIFSLSAQDKVKQSTNEGRALLLDINYGVGLPGGDMKDRFGLNFDVGLGAEVIMPNNWIFGLGGGIIFGNKVNDKVLENLSTDQGQIIANNSAWAAVSLRERGFHTEVRIGKLIPVKADNKKSGVRLVLGLGFLQHKIRVQEDPQAYVPQITGDFEKGYDRLSNGLMLSEFIGYQHLSKNRLVNFYGGFELTQGFTQNRRDYDFMTMSTSDKSNRLDLLYGFKVGWILPFYTSKSHAENIRY
ncbi:MAG: hypothetical protein ACI8YQ_004663 [Polaribacter sp.]|jgi:hypothetical protein